ncbi:MAG: glutamyl-tRNA reductase [Anaerovibrio sp.]|nr:glutamyl-tRNA reductase [Anaerovibrio sp.]
MQLIVLGLNHRTAPVEIREKFCLPPEVIRKGLEKLYAYDDINEAVVLSTCNRSEIYAVVRRDCVGAVAKFWMDLNNTECSGEFFEEYTYCYADEECIEHLLRVTASLDSLVIGEGQILSQVKQAYNIAQSSNATSTVLNLMFNRAIATGKRVRSETRIAYSAVSVSYAAVELARDILGDFTDCQVLLFGAGKMAELTATHLVSRGLKSLYVANRHVERATELAERFNGQAVEWPEVYGLLQSMDIVITSTGAPHYVIHKKEVLHAIDSRQGKPLVLIDIAVPRDVDPAVGDCPGVKLFNIDDLKAVVDDNIQERRKEGLLAEKIIREELDLLMERLEYLSMQPIMAQLSDKAEFIRSQEVRRAMRKLPDITDDELRIIDKMTRMIVRKMLRDPMRMVNKMAGTSRERVLKFAIRKLFKLQEETMDEQE